MKTLRIFIVFLTASFFLLPRLENLLYLHHHHDQISISTIIARRATAKCLCDPTPEQLEIIARKNIKYTARAIEDAEKAVDQIKGLCPLKLYWKSRKQLKQAKQLYEGEQYKPAWKMAGELLKELEPYSAFATDVKNAREDIREAREYGAVKYLSEIEKEIKASIRLAKKNDIKAARYISAPAAFKAENVNGAFKYTKELEKEINKSQYLTDNEKSHHRDLYLYPAKKLIEQDKYYQAHQRAFEGFDYIKMKLPANCAINKLVDEIVKNNLEVDDNVMKEILKFKYHIERSCYCDAKSSAIKLNEYLDKHDLSIEFPKLCDKTILETEPFYFNDDFEYLCHGICGINTFCGELVNFHAENMDILDALSWIADVSGMNLVIPDRVEGTVTMHIDSIPWDQLLDIILEINGLRMKLYGNVTRIDLVESFEHECDYCEKR